jgi:uncharacterized membrane-anchored protein
MPLCNYQAVTLCERVDIQYADGMLVFINLICFGLARYDVAKYTALLLFHLYSPFQ